MPESRKCSRCGAELSADAPGGHCLPCLLQLGLASEETSAEEVAAGILPAGEGGILPTGPSLAEKAGDRIGHYKLLQQIGEGGCGVVYMAEQEEPVRRRVALKIIKLGMDTRNVIARFEAERQALAMLDHPNIAKVFDAGATERRLPSRPTDGDKDVAAPIPAGRPYFVMELVRGIKITTYCDEQELSTRQRLDLFIQVCQAIQHAHQKGIIHRDLKPSNILVTEQDGAPTPKIIDFGIAKATTDQRLTDKTLFTAFEQFIGTPAYMSPEQAGLGGLDIDTRSDIYSLGVLLYELLTGQSPFESKTLSRSALDEILRVIREQEPPRPSTRLTTLTEQELTTVAQRRQIESAKLPKLMRGDLDWIVMKALEKDRRRRYETANDLARDLERFLSHEPVVARPPSNLYKFQKLVRRNKLLFGAGAAVVAALIIGFGFSTVMFLRERQARQREHQLRQEAELRELNLLAFQLLAGGKLAEAEAARRRVLDMQRTRLRNDDPKLATAFHNLAVVLLEQTKLSEAADIYREALPSHLAGWPSDPELGLRLLAEGLARERRYGEIEKLFNAILPAPAESLPHAVGILRARGDFRARRGHFREAAADYARAIELDPARAHDWLVLAVLLVESSQIDAYRELCRKSVERFRNTTEPSAAEQIAKVCLILPDSGIELSAAVQLINFAVSATNNEHIAWFELAKGLAEYRQDHFTSAIEWTQKALDHGRGILERRALAEIVLAMAQQRLKRTDEARAALANARKITDAKLPKFDANDLGRDWHNWLAVRALMREAQALVEGGPGG